MKIYDFKEFLNIEDVAQYLADKNICDFDPWEPLERARLDNILVDINITPIYKIDGTFDVEITRMQAKDTLEIENIGEITLDIIGYFKKNIDNSYSLVKYYNKKDFNLDILYHFLIECNIDKVSAYLLAASGKSVSINPMYFLDFKLHKTKYVTNNNELFEEPPIILEYYQKSQLEAIFNQSDPIEQLQAKQVAELQKQLEQMPQGVSVNSDLKGIEKYNHDKQKTKDFARAIAKSIWQMDANQQIRTNDMVQHIKSILLEVSPDDLPERDESLANWLQDIKPPHATKSGRTPKNAPTEIPLTFKK